MDSTVKNPLVIRCKNCGGDQGFDIVKQKYVCTHCGSESDPSEKIAEYRHWKSLHQEAKKKDFDKVKTFLCPSCGARTIAAGDDVSAQCPFCQNTMIDAEFAGNGIPEVILPFKLTKEEAENRLKEWLSKHKDKSYTETIQKNMQNFSGCYLPYHIVRGAYTGSLGIRLHDGSTTDYPFRAHLSHTAVNASKDLDNLFLDGIEPFDFDEAREFDFGFLNHQKAKLQNMETHELNARIEEETAAELDEKLTKKTHNKELSVLLNDNDNESVAALMPVYLVKCDNGIAAAVNGQTGKISISTGKTKNATQFWWIAPTLATLAVVLAGRWFADWELGFLGGLVFGMIFYMMAYTRHQKKLVKGIITYPKTEKNHNDTRAEFFADFGQGPVPAKIKFFTPWRLVKTILIVLTIIFLPVLIAIPIQLLRGLSILDIKIGYGAAWYIIPGFFSIVAAGGMAKSMMYGWPLYYEILPNGKTRRRRAIFQTKPSPTDAIPKVARSLDKKQGCLVIGIILFLLIGSVAAMIS